MRIIFMGTPDFAVPSLIKLALDGHTIAAVYTQPDRPSGRGRTLVPSPVKTAALALGLPVVQPANLKGAEIARSLADLSPRVIVVAAFGMLLPASVLKIPPLGCVNIHPSLLPRHRGASPVAAAILAGDGFTGVSIMQMDRGLDTGPVLVQAQVPVSGRDTTGSLTTGLSSIAAGVLPEVLIRLERGEILPRPQDDARATYSGSFEKKDGEIDWSGTAEDIWRRVRAFQPWPGCYTYWQGKQLKIIRAVPLSVGIACRRGEVLALPVMDREVGPAVGIGAGSGILGISRLQIEGKQAISAVEFIRGQRQFIGSVLPS